MLYSHPTEDAEKSNFRQIHPYQYLCHLIQHRATRRAAAFVLSLLVFCHIYLSVFTPWSFVPPNPPTPFVLTSLQSSQNTSQRPSLSSALSPVSHLTAPKFRPRCELPLSPRYTSISSRHTNATIYLALNLHNSQSILPTFIHELPILLSFMGSHRFHVSILENGSEDLTPSLLMTLAEALDAIGASYEIVVKGENSKSNKSEGRRIVELAYLRNAALETLYNGKAANDMGVPGFDMVLFMNDIFWCPYDILEIIYEHVTQGAHQTCATDWGGSGVVYDRWVVRSLSGLPFYSQDELIEYFNGPRALQPPIPRPHPYETYEGERFTALKPFQVFSCWNGATVIDARAFFPPPSLPHDSPDSPAKHENNLEGVRFRTALNDVSPVTEKASECFLLSVDLWKRDMNRIMIVPKASVAYELRHYEQVRQDGGRVVKHPIGIEGGMQRSRIYAAHMAPMSDGTSQDDTASDKIQWVSKPPESVVYHDYAWWHEKERWGDWDEA